MITPDNFDLAKDLYYRLTDLNVEITPKFTRTSIGGTDYFNYTDEQREWIQNNAWHKMKPIWHRLDYNPRNLHFDGEPIKIYESARSNKNTYSMVILAQQVLKDLW